MLKEIVHNYIKSIRDNSKQIKTIRYPKWFEGAIFPTKSTNINNYGPAFKVLLCAWLPWNVLEFAEKKVNKSLCMTLLKSFKKLMKKKKDKKNKTKKTKQNKIKYIFLDIFSLLPSHSKLVKEWNKLLD